MHAMPRGIKEAVFVERQPTMKGCHKSMVSNQVHEIRAAHAHHVKDISACSDRHIILCSKEPRPERNGH